ncbi:hypothetical protein EDB86DRAFT_2942123 [Lactarius hatsudake]|nr:hypothetical protein EDB86DRAFT_2942123 [Lactarius hatsudake]
MGVRERHVWSELWSTSLKCKRSLCGISGTCLKAPLSAFSLEISACSHNPPSSHQTPSHTTMNYPNTTATDPYAFSLWPDAAASSEEEMMAWAQVAGYTQPGLSTDSFSFDDLDANTTWGGPAVPQNTDIDWTFGGTVPAGDMLGLGASFLDATATDTMAFAQAPTPPFPTFPTDDDTGAFAQDLFFAPFDFSSPLSSTPRRSPPQACKIVLTQSKALTDASSVPSPQGDGTGNGSILSEAAPSSTVQPPGPSSQLDIPEATQPNQFTYAPPLWFMGDGVLAGQLPAEYLASLDLMNGSNMSCVPSLTRIRDNLHGCTQVHNAIGLHPGQPYHGTHRSVDHGGHW